MRIIKFITVSPVLLDIMLIFAIHFFHLFGAVAEWFKAAVLKTVVRQRTGGSNPPCSELKMRIVFLAKKWSGDREAEGGSLLRSYTPKGYRGFESPLLRKRITRKYEIVAQLDRASDCGSEGLRFDSSQSHQELRFMTKYFRNSCFFI